MAGNSKFSAHVKKWIIEMVWHGIEIFMSKRKSDGLALLTAYFDDDIDSNSDTEEGTGDEDEKQSLDQKTLSKRARKTSGEGNEQ